MSSSSMRYHHLDALRGFAMVVGIFLHGMMSFLFLPGWPAQDIHQDTPLYGRLMMAIHGFRMPLFFLVSGFFTAMMWQRRGARGLLKHRLKRILLPLVVFTILLWPLFIGLMIWESTLNEASSEPRSSPSPSEIWRATAEDDVEAVDAALARGMDVNAPDGMKMTPLFYAAIHDQPEMMDHLLERGASVGRKNVSGMTPLHFAAMFGQTAALEKLVEHGADPNARNHKGQTPMEMLDVPIGLIQFQAGQFGLHGDVGQVEERQEAVRTLLEPHTAPRPERSQWQDLWALYYAFSVEVPLFLHLWFLYYLLLVLGIFLLALWVRRRAAFRLPSWLTDWPVCLFWLIPLTCIPQGFMLQGFGPDTASGFFPWPPTLAYYTLFFLFGAMAYGKPSFENKAGKPWLWLLVGSVPFFFVGTHFLLRHPGKFWAHGITTICASVYAWLVIFALIGFFRNFFSGERPWVRYLSDSSYWLYVAHMPLIMVPQIWVSRWDLPHFPKFLFVSLSTFGGLLLVYGWMVRYTWVGAMLNGRKFRSAGDAERAPSS